MVLGWLNLRLQRRRAKDGLRHPQTKKNQGVAFPIANANEQATNEAPTNKATAIYHTTTEDSKVKTAKKKRTRRVERRGGALLQAIV